MATTRIVRRVLGIALFAFVIAGCGKAHDTKKKEPETTAEKPKKSETPPPESNKPTLDGASEAAKAFLAATTPEPSKLTANFKKVIAPTANDPGKADWEAEQFLTRFVVGKAGGLKFSHTTSEPDTVIGMTATGFIKLVKEPSGWLVDWVHVGPPGERTWGIDGSGATFVTAAFLDTAIVPQGNLIEVLLSPALKAKLAPPTDDLDRARGYNQGILRLKLSNFKGTSTDYTVDRVNDGEATGKLGDGRNFTIKLVKGSKPGEWLVDDFQPQ